jgi:hypothetical protein
MPVSGTNWTPLSDDTRCVNREDRIAPIESTSYVVGAENE